MFLFQCVFYVVISDMTHRQKKREAAEIGERLALWLNGAPQAEPERNANKTRVAELLRLLRELDAEIAKTSGPLSLNMRIGELEAQITQRMERYQTSPRFLCHFATARIGSVHVWHAGAGQEESQALRWIEDLILAEKLVVRCDRCHKWFFRDRRTDRFCEDECRLKNDAAEESNKERKRWTNKKNYWTDELRALQTLQHTAKSAAKLKKARRKLQEAERRLKQLTQLKEQAA
jgi:hypothetical protein